jgi:hypothetical protein
MTHHVQVSWRVILNEVKDLKMRRPGAERESIYTCFLALLFGAGGGMVAVDSASAGT